MKRLAILVMALIVASNITVTVNAKDNGTYLSEEIQGYCEVIGKEYCVAPELLMAMIESESSGNPNAENGNCKGLMQVNPRFHTDRMERLGVTDIYDAYGNILVATDYLMELAEKHEDVGMVLMVYNGFSKAEYYYENGMLSKYAKKILERSYEIEEVRGKHEVQNECTGKG